MKTPHFDLTGRTAFVTGSSRGIGRAVGLRLAAAGARVIFHGSHPGEQLQSAVSEAGKGATSFVADLSQDKGIEALIDELSASSVDILVLNASVQSYTSIASFDEGEFDRQMRTNVGSAFRLIQALAPGMCERGWGRIVAVSSINQLRPAARLAIYSSTKGALANLAAGAAKLYAEKGVTVNTILPGVIVTDRNREKLQDESFAAGLRADIPAHRFGDSDECAALVHFLVSDEAGYITGAEIPIAGGWQL